MRLKVIARPVAESAETIPAYISVLNGQLEVDCLSPVLCDELIDTLANRYFIQDQGFPIFEKSQDSDEFKLNPQTGRLILAGFVDLAASDQQILEAIRDNFRVGEQYDVFWED